MKHLLTTIMALLALAASAYRTNMADAPYNLQPSDAKVLVSEKYAPGADTLALPWAWCVLKGDAYRMSYAQFRATTYFAAAFTDAAWKGEGPGNMAIGFLISINYVEIPAGGYWSNITLTFPHAGFCGQGSFGYYPGSASYTTEVLMDAERWIDTDPMYGQRRLFQTPNFTSESDFGYNESFYVHDLHLTGVWGTDARMTLGIVFGRSGEASRWDRIKSDGFDIGIAAKQGVPMSGGTCSVFHNRIAGFAGIGTALATLRISVVSGDRNGSLVRLMPGYGAASGGSLDVALLKAEDANLQGDGYYGSQILGWFEGQFHVTIANARPTCASRINDAMFVADPIIKASPEWGLQGSYLRASGQGFSYATVLHNLQAKTRRAAPGDFRSWSFEWFAEGDRFASNGPGDWAAKPAGGVPLASLDRDPMTGAPVGSFDYAAGTPARVDLLDGSGPVGPPATPCTWTCGEWGPWGECEGERQPRGRTCLASGDCAGVPEPAVTEWRDCGAPPVDPPTGCDRARWKASANATWSGAKLEWALDGNTATAWTGGRAQAVGDCLQVDVGGCELGQVAFSTGASPWDFPVAYVIEISGDGKAWRQVASGRGSYAQGVYGATFTRAAVQSVRLRLTEKSGGTWLTIAEFTAD